MALPLLLLLLPGLGLSIFPRPELRLQSVVRGDYNLQKVSGVWYSVYMASDNMKRIEENGDLRVFVEKIDIVNNGSLQFFFRFTLNGGCMYVTIVCEKTEKSGEYTLTYEGDNRVLISETDYQLYITFYLLNVRNGTRTQVLALYGRIQDLSQSFLDRFKKVCRRYGLGPQNMVEMRYLDQCYK